MSRRFNTQRDRSDWYLGAGLILVVLISQLVGDSCDCGVEVQLESKPLQARRAS